MTSVESVPNGNGTMSEPELSSRSSHVGYYDMDYYCLEPAVPVYSYIQDAANYLRSPIQPHQRRNDVKHFHLPSDRPAHVGVGTPRSRAAISAGTPSTASRPVSRSGMWTLVEQLQHRSQSGGSCRRRDSPANSCPGSYRPDQPIELAHYPDAKVPDPRVLAAIERDDFPAPPHPYSDAASRHRRPAADDQDESDQSHCLHDHKLQLKEAELSKIQSGMGRVFLEDLQAHRRRIRNPDPRSSSRTAAANREPRPAMRYNNPSNASPSRYLGGGHCIDDDVFIGYHGHHRSVNSPPPSLYMASALRPCPKPGYGLAPSCFPSVYATGTHSCSTPQLSTAMTRDVSLGSAICRTANSSQSEDSVCGAYEPLQSAYYRRSTATTPLFPVNYDRQYPISQLTTSCSRRLPQDVDKTQLERHLSVEDFRTAFGMSDTDFYKLPEWKRNVLKRAAHLY